MLNDSSLIGSFITEEINHNDNFLDLEFSLAVWDPFSCYQYNTQAFNDVNENGQWDNSNPAIVTFQASVAYNQAPKVYKFKLIITNSNNQSDSDTKIVIVKPESNESPIITFKNLASYIEDFNDINGNQQWDEGEEFIDTNGNSIWDNEYSINCGGSTDGGEDGFECVLLFLDDNYIESVIDPEGDIDDWDASYSYGLGILLDNGIGFSYIVNNITASEDGADAEASYSRLAISYAF